MKTITKTTLVLSIAALFLTTAFAGPAAAHKLVYFRGDMQGTEIDMPQGGLPPTTLAATGHLPGIATLFGQFTQFSTYSDARDCDCNRVRYFDHDQWRQYLYDNCRIA